MFYPGPMLVPSAAAGNTSVWWRKTRNEHTFAGFAARSLSVTQPAHTGEQGWSYTQVSNLQGACLSDP